MTTRATSRRTRRTPQPARGFMSRPWLERYGRTLTGDEIQLVQAYRGIAAPEQDILRKYAARLVIGRATLERSPAAAVADRQAAERIVAACHKRPTRKARR